MMPGLAISCTGGLIQTLVGTAGVPWRSGPVAVVADVSAETSRKTHSFLDFDNRACPLDLVPQPHILAGQLLIAPSLGDAREGIASYWRRPLERCYGPIDTSAPAMMPSAPSAILHCDSPCSCFTSYASQP